MDKKTLKLLNSQLAASAQQEVRDAALDKLLKLFVKEQQWVTNSEKDLKIIWEGLFFLFWHSDKSNYQRDVALKVASIFTQLEKQDKEHAQQWFEAFIYIFNLHWDKVDNYRIDKYLMLVRYQFSAVLEFLKKNDYPQEDVEWFNKIIKRLFIEDALTSKGIPLQICDIYLQELNKADGENISFVHLSLLLNPFLHTMAHSTNRVLINRIQEKVFNPILENNVTKEVESEEDNNLDANGEPKWRDGGKLPLKTEKEILKMLNQHYEFPAFNILLFASEQLMKFASDPSTREENREQLYQLYEKALNLEPKPDQPELTFSQRMLVNKASSFITKKARRRMKFGQQKRDTKLLQKLGKMISNKLMAKQAHQEQLQDLQELQEEENMIKANGDKQTYLEFLEQNGETINGHTKQKNGHHQNGKKQEEEDVVMTINQGQQKKKNKNKKRQREPENGHQQQQNGEHKNGNRRVKFDLNHSQTREFFMYGKVATQNLPNSTARVSPNKASIKKSQVKK